MKIVPAVTKDVNRLFEIEQTVFSNDEFALSKPSFYYHIKRSIIFKAVVDKTIVGYILWLKRKEFYRLYSLAVLPQYQGQKIASTLLQRSLKKCATDCFSLEVKSSNKGAIVLYEKFGFKQKKILKDYYTTQDGVLMELVR